MVGRHRGSGPAPKRYVPVWLDGRERTVAAELTRTCPGWFVVWGPYWRCWSAFARFSVDPLVVHAADVDVLRARMREVEPAARAAGMNQARPGNGARRDR